MLVLLKFPKRPQNINGCADAVVPWESWKIFSDHVFFKLCYASESFTLEAVDRRLKNNSFLSLLTLVVKKLYTVVVPNMHFSINPWRVLHIFKRDNARVCVCVRAFVRYAKKSRNKNISKFFPFSLPSETCASLRIRVRERPEKIFSIISVM